jgi:hypothetical protein
MEKRVKIFYQNINKLRAVLKVERYLKRTDKKYWHNWRRQQSSKVE